jgi:hypothetical protein
MSTENSNFLAGLVLGAVSVVAIVILAMSQKQQPVLTVTEGVDRDSDKLYIIMDGEELTMYKDAVDHIRYDHGLIELVHDNTFSYSNVKPIEQ